MYPVRFAVRATIAVLMFGSFGCEASAPAAEASMAGVPVPPPAAAVEPRASEPLPVPTPPATTPPRDAGAEEPGRAPAAAPVAAVPDTAAEETPSAPAASQPATGSSRRYRAGEDPDFADRMGWPVKGPELLPGSILPAKRIVAYYGNPLSTRMGALGEYPKDEMLERLARQVAEWERADPEVAVQPALHLIAVVAQGDAGPSGKYRTIMRDTLIDMVHGWAHEAGAVLFLDIQVGQSDIRELLPRFEKFLVRPDVHLGIDPEFMMRGDIVPGRKIGTMDASDINYAADYLAGLVRDHNLPPKVLVIHRFTRGMVTNSRSIRLQPEVQIVMHMDGWGASWLKRDTYRDYIVREPVQFTGFKIFYHNDTKKGDPLMTPEDVLRLHPRPFYIQYQ